jgi:SH3-like domain-containing protein
MKDTALIMKPVSTVRSSPDNSGNTLFILHEGTKVKILEKLGEWTRIELADGRQGWLISIDVEVI